MHVDSRDEGRMPDDQLDHPRAVTAETSMSGEHPARAHADVMSSASAAGFYTLVDFNPFGVYVVDADFRLARVSLGAQRVFRNVRPLLGRDFAEVLRIVWPEPFASDAIARFRHTLATGEGYIARDVNLRGDTAELEEYDWRIERLTLPDGRSGVVCFFYDLSERAQWEQTLRATEARLRLATEASGIGIWSWHAARDVAVWENSRPYEILGVPDTEAAVSGERFADEFVAPEDRDAFRATLAAVTRDRVPFVWTGRIRRPDGETRWIELAGRNVGDSDPDARVVGTLRDVTAQRDGEARIRESEERSAFVRRSSGVGFWYCDLPFDVLQWDDLVKAHFHLPPDALVTIDTFYARLHPDDRERTREAIARSIEERTAYAIEYRTVHALTGAIKHIRALGRTFYAEDGTPTRFDGVTLDVTEQHRAEEALRIADRRKDEFLATLSHELRNPLAPLRNGLELIRMAGPNAIIERTRAMMERQLTQLVRLVDDLLDVSRVTSDKMELRLADVDVRTVVEAAVETSMPAITAAGHQLTVTMPDLPVWVTGDSARLAQVIGNLLHNSAKYMHRGGTVQLMLREDAGEAVIVVTDEGIGIPPAMLADVFDRFVQVDRTLEKVTGGLGIGLSLVKRLVEMHRGRVAACSEGEGHGSTFEVRLPVVDRGARRGAWHPSAALGATARGRRILIADDNVDAAESLAVVLTHAGHQVHAVHDGDEALSAAERFRPDVILLDIGMPLRNGYDVARDIRARAWGQQVMVIAVTGWRERDHGTARDGADFDAHLTKPVDLAALLRTIDGGVHRIVPERLA